VSDRGLELVLARKLAPQVVEPLPQPLPRAMAAQPATAVHVHGLAKKKQLAPARPEGERLAQVRLGQAELGARGARIGVVARQPVDPQLQIAHFTEDVL